MRLTINFKFNTRDMTAWEMGISKEEYNIQKALGTIPAVPILADMSKSFDKAESIDLKRQILQDIRKEVDASRLCV